MTSNFSAPQPPQAADSFFDSLRRIGISRTDDRWIGGVAAGLAHRLGVDPLIVRGALLLVTLFGGLGLLLYGLAWALLPERSDGRIHLQEAFRGRFDAALAGAIVMVIIGFSRAGFWWSGWDGLVFSVGLIALIALAAVVVLAIQQGRRAGPSEPSGGPATPFHDSAGSPPPPPERGPSPATAPGNQPSSALTVPFAAAGSQAVPAPATVDGQLSGSASEGGASEGGAESDSTAGEPAKPLHETSGTDDQDDPAESSHSDDTHQSDSTESDPNDTMSTTHDDATAQSQHPGGPGGTTESIPPTPPIPPAGPPQPPTPQPAPTPPPPPKPRVPGPGATLVRVTLGLILLVIALLLAADYTGLSSAWIDPWAGAISGSGWSVELLALGSAVTLFGLGAVLAGLMGRRSGSLGVLGTLAALVAVPMALAHSADVVHRFDWNDSTAYSDETWRPGTASEAADGFDELAGGALRVDLRDLEGITVTDPVEVEMGAGQIIVQVPEGMPISIETSVTGEISTRNLDGWTAQVEGRSSQTVDGELDYGWRFGGNREITLNSPESESPEGVEPLRLEVDLGFGEIVIEERS
ncbi:PspC domain-containing protein [Ruania alkalisoli]|uniref:PspC domain-containing protein n=1 Tax=Ruania alkalisoli TaxID=2779775 RepID=A0A7M1SVY4_9MICO|nr:PspC domain-containing protein [Ruania alkalisoli]QOR71695.1 PspC domain-containing protein [Ruania alkalisoli]